MIQTYWLGPESEFYKNPEFDPKTLKRWEELGYGKIKKDRNGFPDWSESLEETKRHLLNPEEIEREESKLDRALSRKEVNQLSRHSEKPHSSIRSLCRHYFTNKYWRSAAFEAESELPRNGIDDWHELENEAWIKIHTPRVKPGQNLGFIWDDKGFYNIVMPWVKHKKTYINRKVERHFISALRLGAVRNRNGILLQSQMDLGGNKNSKEYTYEELHNENGEQIHEGESFDNFSLLFSQIHNSGNGDKSYNFNETKGDTYSKIVQRRSLSSTLSHSKLSIGKGNRTKWLRVYQKFANWDKWENTENPYFRLFYEWSHEKILHYYPVSLKPQIYIFSEPPETRKWEIGKNTISRNPSTHFIYQPDQPNPPETHIYPGRGNYNIFHILRTGRIDLNYRDKHSDRDPSYLEGITTDWETGFKEHDWSVPYKGYRGLQPDGIRLLGRDRFDRFIDYVWHPRPAALDKEQIGSLSGYHFRVLGGNTRQEDLDIKKYFNNLSAFTLAHYVNTKEHFGRF